MSAISEPEKLLLHMKETLIYRQCGGIPPESRYVANRGGVIYAE